jgi:hypothetical protein
MLARALHLHRVFTAVLAVRSQLSGMDRVSMQAQWAQPSCVVGSGGLFGVTAAARLQWMYVVSACDRSERQLAGHACHLLSM